jgi:hypothetical protein
MRTRRLLPILAAASLAGCAAPDAPDAVSASDAASSSAIVVGQAHILRKTDPSAPPAPRFAAPQLQYYGGHVIPNVHVIPVFWTSGVDATTKSQISGFFSAVGDSRYMDWLQEYDTNVTPVGGGNGTNQHIGRGDVGSTVTITPAFTGTTVDDTDIATEINAQINAGVLPAPDDDTLYMTYFPPGYTITLGGSQSCSTFCAYHNTFLRGGTRSVFYGVMPDLALTGPCGFGCGSSLTSFDNLTSVSSHEMIEAVTDAEIGLVTGNTLGPPAAWYDPQGTDGEIGDICNGQPDTIAGYTVQQEWSNHNANCITFDPTVPTPTPTPTPPPPTPTPNPTSTPKKGGVNGLKDQIGCSVGDLGSASGALGSLAALGLAMAVIRRRRRS